MLGGYLALVHSLVLGAGLLGHLTVGGLGVLLAAAVAAALWLARRSPRESTRAGDGGPLTATALFAWLGALTAAGVWAWPHLRHATRLWIWDDYTYHMVYPALWLREHAIAAPGPAQTS